MITLKVLLTVVLAYVGLMVFLMGLGTFFARRRLRERIAGDEHEHSMLCFLRFWRALTLSGGACVTASSVVLWFHAFAAVALAAVPFAFLGVTWVWTRMTSSVQCVSMPMGPPRRIATFPRRRNRPL